MSVVSAPTASNDIAGRSAEWLRRLALPVYAVTIFLSAFLLFSVQPMFTKMVVPTLGGTPAVWSVAMVFFQAVLLAGYLYAHGLIRLLDARRAAFVHLALVAIVVALALPIAFSPSWGRPPAEGQAFWLIAVFAASVGLPFFAVSANGPLLQSWFSISGHAHAKDPYFLYGASNLGSFAALLAYPFLIEPYATLQGQSTAWSKGFVLLGAAIAACALVLAACRQRAQVSIEASTAKASAIPAAPITAARRLRWIGLSLVPSALLIAFTAHISTDIAAVPLLWVIPLSLFLLTFVVAFSGAGARWHKGFVAAQPVLLAIFVASLFLDALVPLPVTLAIQFAFFFVSVMVCHGQLYADRPDASQLTEFYFLMSLGGVLGGIFASLAAPTLFNDILEYHLMVIAAVLCRPGTGAALAAFGTRRAGLIAGALALAFIAAYTTGALPVTPLVCLVVGIPICALMLVARKEPLVLAAMTSVTLAMYVLASDGQGIISKARSFFAVHVVRELPDGNARYLRHGGTIHGGEWIRDPSGAPAAARPEPASYFYRGGPYAEAIDTARAAHGGHLGKVAVIGLGMGSLACHAKAGEGWHFYEIDPVVVDIARDDKLFRSFNACAPGAPVVIGDGRLTLADAKEKYDLIILDAFSSDAIPTHLVTAEALRVYADKLADRGTLIFNITNRFMEIEGVVAGSAAAGGMTTFVRADRNRIEPFDKSLKALAKVAVVGRKPEDLGAIATGGSWRKAEPTAGERVWTDDYSNIIGPIRQKLGW